MMTERALEAPSILIVEDEAIVAQDLSQTLNDQGFGACAIAASADEALAHAEAKHPDLVLMDIRLEGSSDGIAVAGKLRERFGTTVIYLTAHADESTFERAKYTEPAGYLLKPVKSTELKISIELALHKRSSSMALEQSGEEQRLRRASIDTVERLAALGRMAAGVAHQINNPLAIVVANADVVACELERQHAERVADSRTLPSDLRRLNDTIEAQAELSLAAQRIAHIVANIRSFSEPASQLNELSDVRRAVDSAISLTTLELGGRARLALDLAGAVPAAGVSEARLAEVLKQLLLNAAHAIAEAPGGRDQITVHAGTDAHGQCIIEVSDTGVGMTREVQERIFEPFFTTKPLGVGTGLGLSICHGIVTAAGGRLEVESRAGHGTRFRVVLPSGVRAPMPLIESSARETPPARRSVAARALRERLRSGPARAVRARRRILVVDDEPLLLRSVRRLLPEYELVCLESARQALALLDAGSTFDLIVSDLMMPEMNGIDFYEALRARHPRAAERVIFVTGGALGQQVGRFLGSVPNARLEKPFAAHDLRRAIRDALV
jgi:two-component system cell cycle sensor histidine kinase/response regulator CckA